MHDKASHCLDLMKPHTSSTKYSQSWFWSSLRVCPSLHVVSCWFFLFVEFVIRIGIIYSINCKTCAVVRVSVLSYIHWQICTQMQYANQLLRQSIAYKIQNHTEAVITLLASPRLSASSNKPLAFSNTIHPSCTSLLLITLTSPGILQTEVVYKRFCTYVIGCWVCVRLRMRPKEKS